MNQSEPDIMETRAFAEQILFGESMGQKLYAPPRLTDTARGQPLRTKVTPGRPAGLRLNVGQRPRTHFPSIAQLEKDSERGKALHFFANHELLALELMALTLLRFPDAPALFRRKLVATMRDEQKHMRLYLDRMRELGTEFGETALNGFFWDLLSQAESPEHFSAGMSLTLEQANIDFSIYYRDAFVNMGDTKSATIMEEVLRDEVAHVRHGVQFLKSKLIEPKSLWQHYCAHLTYPMTPARAKGPIFNEHYRERAGLDRDFIDRLSVFNHSRGRSPNVFIFNSNFEDELINPGATKLSRTLERVNLDLRVLPIFLAKQDDLVLLSHDVPIPYLKCLQTYGFPIPELVTHCGPFNDSKNPLRERQFEAVIPWGWTPGLAQRLEPLRTQIRRQGIDFNRRVMGQQEITSKAWIARQTPRLLDSIPKSSRQHFVRRNLPKIAESFAAITRIHGNFMNAGYSRTVVKAPFGAAGRNALRVSGELFNDPKAKTWIERTLGKQKQLVIEPWYETLMDISCVFRVDSDYCIRELEFTHFETDAQGQYLGTYLNDVGRTCPSNVRHFIFQAEADPNWLWTSIKNIVDRLRPDFRQTQFTGYAGIDLILIRDVDDEIKVRAPLELNPRPTMGHIARRIGRRIDPSAAGIWMIFNKGHLRRLKLDQFSDLQDVLTTRIGDTKHGKSGRLKNGLIPTTPSSNAAVLWTCALVTPNRDKLQSILTDMHILTKR
ncbi:MAG: DUF455 family protein [Myxococcota bacterium]|nr:DUF455 family protein [Myxococcota bacterium]